MEKGIKNIKILKEKGKIGSDPRGERTCDVYWSDVDYFDVQEQTFLLN